MFAHPESTFGSPRTACAHTRHPRHEWMAQCWRRHSKSNGHREVSGCGRRLSSQQFKAEVAAQTHVPARSTIPHTKPTTRALAQCSAPRDVEANAEVSAAYARKVASHRPPLPAALSLASPKSISSFTEPDSLKLAVPSSTASHPKVDGDNDDSSEAGQSEDDEELWDEMGEEIPAEWDDDQPARKHTGKAVPPGEYFTIVRGPKKAKANPADPPGSGDQLRQQDNQPSKSAGKSSKRIPENRPSAPEQQGPTAAAKEPGKKQLLPVTEVKSQQCQPNTAASTQLSTAAVTGVEPDDSAGDNSLDSLLRKIATDSRSSSNQETGLQAATTSESRESKAQRLKKRVLTGGKQAAYTQGPPPGHGHHPKAPFVILPGSRPLLHLSSDLDRLGQQPGFFSDLLIAGDFLTPTLKRHADISKSSLGLQINQCIVACKSWPAILNVVRDLAPVFGGVNVSTAIHRIAKLFKSSKAPSHLLLEHPHYALLIEATIKLAPIIEARAIANIMWGLATLKDQQSPLLPCLDSRLLEMDLGSFVEQELSNVIWAYGTMQYQQNTEFMHRAAQEMLNRGVNQFAPQALSNACWAFAKHDLIYDEFLKVTGDYVAEQLPTWNTQGIANIVWAYAKMELCHDALMAAVATNLTANVSSRPGAPSHPRIEDFKCQEICNVMVAFARLSTYNAHVLQLVEIEMSKPHRIQEASQQGVVNVMWAFATLRYYPTQYFDAVVPHLELLLPDFNDQELSNCLWAFGRLAHHPGKLMGVFCKALDHQVRSNRHFSLQATTNSLWSMAVLASAHNGTAMRLAQYLYSHHDAYQLEIQLHQTFQAVLLARIQAIMAGDKELAHRLVMPAKMQARTVKCWKNMMRSSRVSVFQRDVSDIVAALQIEHQMEYLAQDGLFSVDIAILTGDKNVAIEVDGPYHYTLNTHQPLGHTLLRRRLLTAMGWKVVSVPYFDWSRLQSGVDKAHYMARLLTQQGLELPDSDLLHKASGVHMGNALSSLHDVEAGADSMRGVAGPFRDQDPAEVPSTPSRHRSQSKSERLVEDSGPDRLSSIKQQSVEGSRTMESANLSKPHRKRSSPNRTRIPLSKVQLFRASTASDSSAGESTATAPDLPSFEATHEARERESRTLAGAATPLSTSDSEAEDLQQEQTLQHATQPHTSIEELPSGSVNPVAAEETAMADRAAHIKGMKLASELRPLCKQYGLPVAGLKVQVVQRILEYEALQDGLRS